MFAAIRNDQPYNEAELGANATITAILGRMCTYPGQEIEWEATFNSRIDLLPKTCSWDAPPPVLPYANGFYPVAMPGRTVTV